MENITMINRILGEQDSASNGRATSSASSDEANRIAEAVTEQAKQLQKRAEQLITSHPVAALGVAVIAGLVIGWWVKRK
ncbi:MAG: hypothetical protein ABI614_11820 [Planctomycetota bacterium]